MSPRETPRMTLFQALSRLPAGLWLRGLAGVLLVAVLATFGLAVLAGAAVVAVLAVAVLKARSWFVGSFARDDRGPGSPSGRGRVVEAQYVIVDRRDARRR